LSRDLFSRDYYITKGGRFPVRWTAPEVGHTQPDTDTHTHARTFSQKTYAQAGGRAGKQTDRQTDRL
jgi:hypothetical protein